MEVESEIYRETDFQMVKLVENGSKFNLSELSMWRGHVLNNVFFKDTLSKFNFSLPDDVCDSDDQSQTMLDKDGDLVVKRLQCKAIEIGRLLFLKMSV